MINKPFGFCAGLVRTKKPSTFLSMIFFLLACEGNQIWILRLVLQQRFYLSKRICLRIRVSIQLIQPCAPARASAQALKRVCRGRAGRSRSAAAAKAHKLRHNTAATGCGPSRRATTSLLAWRTMGLFLLIIVLSQESQA